MQTISLRWKKVLSSNYKLIWSELERRKSIFVSTVGRMFLNCSSHHGKLEKSDKNRMAWSNVTKNVISGKLQFLTWKKYAWLSLFSHHLTVNHWMIIVINLTIHKTTEVVKYFFFRHEPHGILRVESNWIGDFRVVFQ